VQERKRRKPACIGVRAPIVAMKPGNAGGAKGCRKMEAGCQDRRKKTERKCLKRLSKTEKSEPDGQGGSCDMDRPNVDSARRGRQGRQVV